MSLKDLLDEKNFPFRVERAFGKPYERNGTMVIPVGLVAGGMGGGGGSSLMPEASADPSTAGGEGFGGGVGGVVLPLGAYVVRDDKVRWVPVIDATRVLMGLLALMRLLLKLRATRALARSATRD